MIIGKKKSLVTLRLLILLNMEVMPIFFPVHSVLNKLVFSTQHNIDWLLVAVFSKQKIDLVVKATFIDLMRITFYCCHYTFR
jgi:predicted deacetylase